MTHVRTIGRIQLFLVLLFAFFKFIRPDVLERNPPEWIQIVLYSLPNFFEAVIGILTLTFLGLYLNRRLENYQKSVRESSLFLIATVMAGIYVITQELKIHNLGGNNVYDKNDLIFSGIGLVVGYFLVRYLKPTLGPLSES